MCDILCVVKICKLGRCCNKVCKNLVAIVAAERNEQRTGKFSVTRGPGFVSCKNTTCMEGLVIC